MKAGTAGGSGGNTPVAARSRSSSQALPFTGTVGKAGGSGSGSGSESHEAPGLQPPPSTTPPAQVPALVFIPDPQTLRAQNSSQPDSAAGADEARPCCPPRVKYVGCGAVAVGLLLTAAVVFGVFGDRFDEDPGSDTFKTHLPLALLSTLFVGAVLGSCLGETYFRQCVRESA